MTDDGVPHEGVTLRTADRLRDLWAQDRPAFGLWSVLPDAAVAETLAATPFDFVCLDLQHGAATFGELTGMVQGMRAAGEAPVVRVPWNEPAAIMRALDTGAAAVVVPMVNSADEARRAAAACRFPPQGERSWGPTWGGTRAETTRPPAEQDAAVLCLVMVETLAGVESVEEIAGVPGVDGIFIGPNDLALGCGHGRATYRDSAEVDALIQRIVDTCREAGIVAGLYCSDTEMAVHWAGRGARMLSAAQDTSLLHAGAAQAWAAVGGADRG